MLVSIGGWQDDIQNAFRIRLFSLLREPTVFDGVCGTPILHENIILE